jgi:hypothetical protein
VWIQLSFINTPQTLLSTRVPKALKRVKQTHDPLRLLVGVKTKLSKLRGLSRRANYTDRASSACRRSKCQLFCIEGVAWSAQRIPISVFPFSTPEPLLFLSSSSLVVLTRLSGPCSKNYINSKENVTHTQGPHCLDSRLTVNCEILATCSSTYSPVRTSQEAHSVSIK